LAIETGTDSTCHLYRKMERDTTEAFMRRELKLMAITAALSLAASGAVKVEKVNYKGWPNSYRVGNGEIELVVTGDVGPRIMHFGFAGGQNLLKEYPEQLGKSGEEKFQLRGGHRVWKAPEDPIATWAPDNVPVQVTVTASGLTAREPVEPLTGLQKEISVEMAASGTQVKVTHRIVNKGLFPLEFAPWALTMMAQGGVAITGFPPRGKHPEVLEATNPLVMWAYTDLSDKRWTFTKKYMLLRQDPKNSEPQKLGHYNPRTKPEALTLDRDRLAHWLKIGARPSDTVRTLVDRLPIVAPAAEVQAAS